MKLASSNPDQLIDNTHRDLKKVMITIYGNHFEEKHEELSKKHMSKTTLKKTVKKVIKKLNIETMLKYLY